MSTYVEVHIPVGEQATAVYYALVVEGEFESHEGCLGPDCTCWRLAATEQEEEIADARPK